MEYGGSGTDNEDGPIETASVDVPPYVEHRRRWVPSTGEVYLYFKATRLITNDMQQNDPPGHPKQRRTSEKEEDYSDQRKTTDNVTDQW